MLAPLSWLRDFAPFDQPVDDLAAALSGLGLVVEGVERVGEGLADVIVAKVLATRAHPGADRVQLVEVDAGGPEPLQIVCGAFNFEAGDLVPLAPVGARLPGDFEIGRRKVRGEWSEGMMCSASELRLSSDHSGIMILAPGSAEPGLPLVTALGIEADVVFELDVTPNRPDALCMVGVARDLAANLKIPFRRPPVRMSVPVPAASPSGSDAVKSSAVRSVAVRIDAPDLCGRFTATRMTVAVGPSPAWIARRLTLAGMRPINNIVDISNYVMLELGQPNHPYDLDLLGGGILVVRRAEAGETMATLDEVERRLEADDCLICDGDGVPVGIGGIMGGARSGIRGGEETTCASEGPTSRDPSSNNAQVVSSPFLSDTTTDVVLEAAWFSPLAIARTSKRLGLRTEASVRFERGVDPDGIDRAVARFCGLAAQVASASMSEAAAEALGELPAHRRVRVRTARVNAVLGTDLTTDQVKSYLDPIGFSCEPVNEVEVTTDLRADATADVTDPTSGSGDLTVAIPSWRPDSEREIDVIEEVARHHGYANIPRRLPPVRQVGGLNAYQRDRRLVREILVGAGLSEAWSTWFLGPADLERVGLPTTAVEVENPLVADECLLAPSLLPGLLRAVSVNVAHRHPDVGLFEISHVFVPPAEGAVLPDEPEHLGVALAGRDAGAAMAVWRVLAGALGLTDVQLEPVARPGMHPTRCVTVAIHGEEAGHVGEVDPGVLAAHQIEGRVGWMELDLGLLLDASQHRGGYRPVSRYPSADLDLAFVVPDSVQAEAVHSTLVGAAGEFAESVELFDVFRGGALDSGVRSLAFHLRFATLDHTLSEQELTKLRTQCIEAVASAHGATLRS